MSQNGLSHIPTGLFLNLNYVRKLMLFSNNFTSLDANDFEGLVNVTNLLLNNNNLKNFHPEVFVPLTNLVKL